MKKLLLILCILGFAALSQAQRKTKPKTSKAYVSPSTQFIEYDLKNGKYKKDLQQIKVHTPVVFKITNVNPFAYKIVLTPKDSVVASSGFDKEFMDFFTSKDLQKAEAKLLQDQADANKELPNQVEAVSSSDFKMDKKIGTTKEQEDNKKAFFAIEEIKSMKRKNEELKTTIASKLDSLLKDENTNSLTTEILKKNSKDEIHKTLSSLQDVQNTDDAKEQTDKTIRSIVKIKGEISKNEIEIKKKETLVNEKTREYQVLVDDFLKKYSIFREDCKNAFELIRATKYIGTIAENPDLTHELYSTKYKRSFEANSEKLSKGIETVDNYRKSYSDLGDAYFRLVSMNNLEEIMLQSGIDKALSYPKFLKIKADQLSAWLSKYNWENVLRQAIWTVEILNNEENYTIKSAPIQPENDMVQFTVEIAKRDNKNADHFYKLKNFTYQQAVYGGTRVDFSLGLAAAYYGKTSKFEIHPATGTLTSYKKKLIAPSLVGMVTMSYRSTGYIAYGGSAGMGLDVAGGKVQLSNFFIGPSMLLGKKDRIFFTLGASLKNVRELKNGYEGTMVPTTDDFTSYTRDKYKIGVFAAITYSLTKDARALIKRLR